MWIGMGMEKSKPTVEELVRRVDMLEGALEQMLGAFKEDLASYRSKCIQVLRHVNEALAAWVRRKFKRFRRRERASVHWLGGIAQREPALFAHWRFGAAPAAEIGGAG